MRTFPKRSYLPTEYRSNANHHWKSPTKMQSCGKVVAGIWGDKINEPIFIDGNHNANKYINI